MVEPTRTYVAAPPPERSDAGRIVSAFPVVTLLRIEPLQGGWVLLCTQNNLAQIYRSGAEAERQARHHAKVLALCGFAPRLAIIDRAGRFNRVRL